MSHTCLSPAVPTGGLTEDGHLRLKVGLPVSAALLVVAAFGVVSIYKKKQRLASYQPLDEQQSAL